ncbi:aspartate aminotransferase family protein [Microbulbifer magnicolonia]|uniref:aminotransferase family protein n=1 Tax=Microbulbifer magnicolonia TaxID=3109744 RepID=UPI002B41668A|nr:aminotransferase class III-fold pyridoxal phosphate-dependent enzyme [Microbulbifer sp. GG15]
MNSAGIRPERETVLHSWCRQADWRAPTIVGGEAALLFAEDGRRILDMSSLAECSNLGHQHPKLIQAIREQAEKLCFVTAAWGAEPRAALAQALLEKSGFDGGRVFFTLGGADANENAIKFARQASNKPRGKVITRDRSYHGASYAAMALSGDARTRAQVEPEAFGVLHARPPYPYRCPFNSQSEAECGELAAAEVAALIDGAGREHVAAVLMEPNAGTNGIVAPDNYWPQLRALTRDRGVYLIADEVMSGFGRCGEWFAWQRHGADARPDLMTIAKGLTGAHLPLGAVVLSREISQQLEHEMLYTGLTYCGHPLSCAAGVAAIAAYDEENLVARSRALGAELFAQLKKLQQRHQLIGDVRGGHGLFAVLELVADRNSRAPLAPWPQAHPALITLLNRAMDAGVSFASRGNLLILAPPLVITEQQLSDAVALLDELLTAMATELTA